MSIDYYIKEREDKLKEAYSEVGNKIYWSTRYGDNTRVVDMPSQKVVECLDMLDKANPKSYWHLIFKEELLNRECL